MMDTHSFAEVYAKDLEAFGCARVALNKHGEPAKSRKTTVRSVMVTAIEQLPGYRTRLTLETGRTMTVSNGRWVLAEHVITEAMP